MNYPEDLKQKMIKRMLPPDDEPIQKIAREEGIAEQTLRNWQKTAREKGIAAPGKDTAADQWTPDDKFLIVVETAKMNESELAEYVRQKGLFVEQIKAWKDACLQANGGVAKEAAELNKKLKESEKSLIGENPYEEDIENDTWLYPDLEVGHLMDTVKPDECM